jgi:predicted permease
MIATLHRLLARLRALRTVDALDEDFAEELHSDLEMRAAAYEQRGHTPQQALAQARRELGGLTALREAHRTTRGVAILDHLWRDLRLSLRTLRRTPTFTVFAISILALGLGAAVTVYSLVHALVLAPLPFHRPDRLVWVANLSDDGASEWRIQVNHLRDLQASVRTLDGLAGYYGYATPGNAILAVDGRPERLTSQPITHGLLSTLGVVPEIGRAFSEEESRFNGPPAVILSHRVWQERFAGNRSLVGQAIMLDGRAVPVVGVLPASFDFASVFAPGGRTDVFVPFPLSDETNRSGNTVAVVGRLAEGATMEAARAELHALAGTLERRHPERNSLRPLTTPLAAHVSGHLRASLGLLAGAVLVVMLIVSANLANLQLVRAGARRREFAVRAALGADATRLVVPAVIDGLLLSAAGSVGAMLVATLATRLLSSLEGISLPLLQTVRVEMSALVVLALAAAAVTVLVGVLPGIRVARQDAQQALKDGSRGNSMGRAATLVRHGLVVAEVTLACILLVGAGLLVRSLIRVLDVPLGFQPDGAVAIRIDPDRPASTRAARNAHFDQVLAQVRDTPGVLSAGLTDVLPLDGNRSRGVRGQGQVFARGAYPEGFVRVVSDGYAGSLGVSVVAGRDLTAADHADGEPVALVNETLARTLWPGQDPLGQVLVDNGPPRRIVGVLADVRHRALERASGSELYLPLRQTDDYRAVYLLVRGAVPAAPLVARVRDRLATISPDLPTNDVRILANLVDRAVSPRRFMVWLLSAFAVFAAVLAALGIYAVVAYTTSLRLTEFGVRLALGASAASLRRTVLSQAVRLAVIGVVAGTAGAAASAAAASDLLFEVSPRDLATFAGAAVVMVLVAVAAAYGPAAAAARVEPLEALRNE